MGKPGAIPDVSADPAQAWARQDAAGRQAMLAGILARVSREALQAEGLDAVLKGIVECLMAQLPVAIASIILLDETGRHFVQEVCAGTLDLDAPAGASEHLVWPVTIGAAGRCVRTGQAQLLADVDADPDYISGNRAVRAEYLVPIRHRGRTLGVLNLESTRADFFIPDACAVFDAVADQVAGAIHLARVASELEAANRQLRHLSMTDGLTGIANRRSFDQQLAADWQRLAADRTPLALLLVDADGFKALNDGSGHLYGDECLRTLAGLCRDAAGGPPSLVARYGGEEIALLLPGHDLRQARRLAERLRKQVERLEMRHPSSAVSPHVTVSIGVSMAVPDLLRAPEALVASADRALYAAKTGGRNRVSARAAT